MKRLTIILLVFIILLLIGGYYFYDKFKKEQATTERLNNNIRELIDDNTLSTRLALTEREARGKVTRERDSLAKALQIRPKTITKIVERTIVEKDIDTVTVFLELNKYDSTLWYVTDSDKCWTWKANLSIIWDEPIIERTSFEYRNAITEVFWWERNKFLGLKIGKKVYYQQTRPQCGKEYVDEVKFVKK